MSITHPLIKIFITLLFTIIMAGLKAQIASDTIFIEDIIAVQDTFYLEGDTAFVMQDGRDTLIVLDTVAADIDTSGLMEGRLGAKSTDIIVDLGVTPLPVNYGLFGMNVSSMFDHLPESAATAPQWNMLSALTPKTLRFPDGRGGKLDHPLGSLNADGTMNGGYGLLLPEIIRYMDYTDGHLDVDVPGTGVTTASIIADMNGIPTYQCEDCYTWMDATDYRPSFEDFYREASSQVVFTPAAYPDRESQPLFINQFIRLVQKIETDHPGHIVDVIVCLNIMSETAQTSKDIITYLRTNTIHPVNAIGVEIGNESGSSYFYNTIGYSNFNQYWDYISTDGFDFNLAQACPSMVGHHNFLKVFKGDPTFSCKVGIPADNLYGTNGAGLPYALRHNPADMCWMGSGIGLPPGPPVDLCGTDWNTGLAAHENSLITIGAGPLKRKAFDAFIIHPYFDANDNWLNIPTCIPLANFPYTTPWDFAIYDSDLKCAFDGMIGIGNTFGNIKEFITSRYKESYDAFNVIFDFKNAHKELWETERNIKDQGPDDRYLMYDNTFTHCIYFQECLLKDLKVNYDPDYGNHNSFFTRVTLQNYAGGTGIDLLSKGDAADLAYWKSAGHLLYGIPAVNDYVPRTTYFADSILNDIVRKNLDYLPSTTTMYKSNNLPPTVFLAPDKSAVYVYYTNVRDHAQSYIINCGHLIALFPGAVWMSFGTVSLSSVQAQQLYSSSGKTALFLGSLNSTYGSSHPVEIVRTNSPVPYSNMEACSEDILPGSICVTVPAYSEGYFKIPITFNYTPSPYKTAAAHTPAYMLYPNPTANSFAVIQTNKSATQPETVSVALYDATGTIYLHKTIKIAEVVDIHTLPAGVYFAAIADTQNQIVKLLVKQ